MTMPTPKCPKCGRNMDFHQMGKGDEDYWECDPYPSPNSHEDCVNIWHSDAQADYITALEARIADLERQLTAARDDGLPPPEVIDGNCPLCNSALVLEIQQDGTTEWVCRNCWYQSGEKA